MSRRVRAGVDVAVAAVPDCPRCGGEGLLSARVPHGWDRAGGARTEGTAVVVLCARCDAGDPAAGPLITFFHVHGRATSSTVAECADLLARWVDSIELPRVDVDAVDAEAAAWRRGDL